jgi:hypothetical protein
VTILTYPNQKPWITGNIRTELKARGATYKEQDDTTVVGLITDDDEPAYREEVRDLAVWCQDNNLSLNISQTKELIMDCRKQRAEHFPSDIDRAVVQQLQVLRCPHH